jgi:hypothetical protein
MKLYSYIVPQEDIHSIEWEEQGGMGGYTAGIIVAAYRSDRLTPLFVAEEDNSPSPQAIFAAPGEKIYVVVEAAYGGGTFSLTAR